MAGSQGTLRLILGKSQIICMRQVRERRGRSPQITLDLKQHAPSVHKAAEKEENTFASFWESSSVHLHLCISLL